MDKRNRKKKTVDDTVCEIHKFSGYAVLSNCFVRSTNLGCPAIGLLGRVMDLPPEWNFSKAGLIAICPDGETAIDSALNDLKEWGYLEVVVKMPNENPTGRIQTVYKFYEYSAKLGVVGGIAFAAYKLGECNGEVNERMREKYGDEDDDGIGSDDDEELPTDSIRELIANAVAHRSYLEPGNIQVALYDDRLEITSPGMLLNNVTIEKMIEGYSRPRNPAIARAFAYMKIIEKWGTGIPRLFAACEEYGLPKPELIDFDGDFRVNMYRKRDANTETNTETNTENVGRIIRLMGEQPSITVKMIAQQLGLSVGGVRYHINKLKKDGVVEHIGSSKKGTWVIHD